MGEAVALEQGILAVDSVTRLSPQDAGKVVVAGSHGGIFAAFEAAEAGVRAVILNDAGVGKDGAGIAGMAKLGGIGLASATVSHRSARIGDGRDMAMRGIISHVNDSAARLGVHRGQPCLAAARLLLAARLPTAVPPQLQEARGLVRAEPGGPRVWVLDSVSLVNKDDIGQVVVTGSHGGLLGGRPETALKVDCLAAVYNDAGLGIDDAGIGRLPALDRRAIAAGTVAAGSARIGDGRSTWETGIISHVNETAAATGAAPGMSTGEFVARVIAVPRRRGQ